MERALLLFLEFDGTSFCGWQRQPHGRSVQLVVEGALSELAGSPRKAVAAGRTDAGVHALAMPVSTAMADRWTCGKLLRALNSILPSEIAVRQVRAVSPGTDARRSALERRYRYDVGIDAAARSPFRSRTEWAVTSPLALDAMQQAAEAIRSQHDFRAFAAVGEPKPHYDCTITEADWSSATDGRLRFMIAADRFLHHMVRMLVGTMIDIGLGRRPVADMAALLARRDNSETSPPAPAAGLSFVSARYPDSCLLEECATW
ncbi:MAG TPA: tRNA pseudouridine(38-40) synthase TruA [Gemmatimonadales bacterium]|jgi:tRNA pseudouridine38-40 synthase